MIVGGCTLLLTGKRSLRRTRGLSLLELVVVLGIILIVSSMGFINITGAMRDARVSTGYNQVLTTLRRARETAISERRVYLVRLLAPGTECNSKTQTTGLSCVILMKAATSEIVFAGTLPSDVGYIADANLPNTLSRAPDQLVTGTAGSGVCFDIGVTANCTAEVYFQPDGSARDINGFVNNGVIYIARAGEIMSSRAVTVMGATGRIRGWRVGQLGSSYYWDQR